MPRAGLTRSVLAATAFLSSMAGLNRPLYAQETALTTNADATAAEQQQFLDRMRKYAGQYISRLPDFLCEQMTEQFEAGKKTNHWHKGDTLTSKLVFARGREQRTLEQVNDKPVGTRTRAWKAPLTTEGEFGVLLGNIFDLNTATQFTWKGWDNVRGHKVAVFDYAVDREHSTMSLSLSDLARAVVPYGGEVYGDPESGAVWRVTNGTTEIPEQVQTKSIATTIDYGEVQIGGAPYLLPIQATVVLATDKSHIRNEIRFQGYRKFGAESSITFSTEDGDGKQKSGGAGTQTEPPH